jgi:hypothetical protein
VAGSDALEGRFRILEGLERDLHTPQVRGSATRLALLLHPQFVEIGRSGRSYSREDVLGEFAEEEFVHVVWSQDYEAQEIAPGLVLLTYRSAHVANDGTLERYTARASLWQQTACGWQLRFHQGTPTEAFDRPCAP